MKAVPLFPGQGTPNVGAGKDLSGAYPAATEPDPSVSINPVSEEITMASPSADVEPLVTVVTVTFNLVKNDRAALFRRCAESVHEQTYGAIEHIVIDGASSDGTRELIAEYEAKGWLTCRSEPDKGIYDAMNKGIAAAKGKYIAFLNSDDYWHDSRGVEWSVRCLERAQGDFSYAPYNAVRADAGKCDACMPELGGFCSSMPFCHQTMFTRTELLRAAGGFDAEHYRIAADYDMILHLLVRGAKPVFVPLNFTTFRRDGISAVMGGETEKEASAARERQLQPLVPEPVTEALNGCYLPHSLYLVLSSLLHPAAVQALADAHAPEDAAGLHLLRRSAWLLGTSRIAQPDKVMQSGKKCTGLLGLPLLSSRILHPGKLCYLLFGFLPIWSVQRQFAKGKTVGYLFGLLPLVCMQRRVSGTVKCSVLGLPVWGSRYER